MSELRPCKLCSGEFPATTEHFHRHPAGYLGLSNVCKPCARARAKASKDARKGTPEYKERINADARRYQKRHAEKQREYRRNWRQANPDKCKEYAQKRQQLVAAGGSYTAAEWGQKVSEAGHRCHYCKQQPDKLVPDHYIPLSRGGSNTIDNIVPACPSCNASKHAAMPADFLRRRAAMPT